jgi:hypothetical protein
MGLLGCGFGVAVNAHLRDMIEEIVVGHDLDADRAPAWMFEFLSRIRNRHLTPRSAEYEIPAGYPHGENGLFNVLADISEVYSLGLDDYGEGLTWSISGLGIRVSVIREWLRSGFYGVIIEPTQ